MSKLTRVSPGIYRTATGKLTYSGKRTQVRSSRGKSKPKTGNNQKKETKVRGKQVSFRETTADGVSIYGTMRVGGVFTYLSTSDDSRAYLRTGDGNSQIVWIAKEVGDGGNLISVTLSLTSTNNTTYVEVVGKAITVHMRYQSGASRSTANAVITAVKASAAAMALLDRVHSGEGTGVDFAAPVAETFLQEGGGRFLHQYITLAAHEINSVDKLYLDDREVVFPTTGDTRKSIGFHRRKLSNGQWESLVFMAAQLGSDGQTYQQDLSAQVGAGQWGESHRQRGCAGVYLYTIFNAGVFPNGMPEVEFSVSGKKVYDFRDGLTKFTSNAALILADCLCDAKLGAGIARANLNATNWAEAADVCDQTLALAAGGTEARYSINGTFSTGASIESTIEEMLQAMAGDLVYQGGEWFCYPGKYRAPVMALSESNLRDEIKITTAVPRRERFNAVRGTFVNAADKYLEADYSPVKNNYYATLDGQVIFEDIPQPFVTSSAQAQRIAKIELERVRQGIEVDIVVGVEALKLTVCDTITLSYARFGWVNKVFEVRDVILGDSPEQGFRIALKLRETAAGIYTWSAEETQRDLAPDTNLPSPFNVTAPTGLTLASGTSELYIRNDGTVFSRLKASWTLSRDIYVEQGGRYEIQYKLSSSSTWLSVTPVDGEQSETYILDVQDGSLYDVRVRAVNSLLVPSDYVEALNHRVLGKSVPPTNPTTFIAYLQDFGIQFEWSKVADLDVRDYELRLGSVWDTATALARVSATTYTLNLRTAGAYQALLKAVDTSGNYSLTAKSVSFSIPAPGAPVVSSQLSGESVVLSWTPSTGAFAIDSYVIKYGTTLASAVTVAQVKALNYSVEGNWLGERIFWVQAVDVAGNLGNAGQRTVNILAPNPPQSFFAEVIDNNVLLRWTAPAVSSLPIRRYDLRVGATYATSSFLGSVFGTFAARFEFNAGVYTYWLETVDSAGNVSNPASITATVDEPPDYEFFGKKEWNFLTDNPTYSDASTVSAQQAVFPVSNETWDQHFNLRSWTTVQAQIDAGYLYLIVPNDLNGSVELVHDFGAVINSSTIVDLTFVTATLAGTVSVVPQLFTSLNGTTYTTHTAGQTRVYATSVRYVKAKWTATATNDKGLATISNPIVSLNVKEGTFSGTGTTGAGDTQAGTITVALNATAVTGVGTNFTAALVGERIHNSAGVLVGTVASVQSTTGLTLAAGALVAVTAGAWKINFGKAFVDITGQFADVISITVTPKYSASYPIIAVYDFVDQSNPTSFTVYTYRADTGVLVPSISFGYTLRGYLA
jgi:hypothetical protein